MEPDSEALEAAFTFDGEWGSKFGPGESKTPEGRFFCLEGASGSVQARFRPVTGPQSDILFGRREPLAPGSLGRIIIVRHDSDNVYVYTGVIADLGAGSFEARGRRIVAAKPMSLPTHFTAEELEAARAAAASTMLRGDDDWVATRPPT